MRKTPPKLAVPAHVEFDVVQGALHPGSIGPIWHAMIRKAFERGALMDLTIDDIVRFLKGDQRAFDAGGPHSGYVLQWRGSRRHYGRRTLEKSQNTAELQS